MTRFARSKGSKACNDREPEEATPWSEMVSVSAPTNPEDEEDADDDLLMEIDDNDDVKEVEKDKEPSKSLEKGVENEIETESQSRQKKRRKQDKCLNCKEKGHLKRDCPSLSEERRNELRELFQLKVERKGHGTGRKKKKRKNDLERKEETDPLKKPLKDKTGQPVQDGEGLFQGFRVKKEDVKRLRKLRKSLLAQKVGTKEMKETLKRERRRAENDLSKHKKTVCYNCRESGHLLADCPTSKTLFESSSTSQCFKCGSEDHTSKDCQSKKLKGELAYRFAVCFICKESGHLAKTCPDNPKGLYPNGGGCRFCGSVEHLKSDCKRKVEKDERQEVKIGRITDLSSKGLEEEIEDEKYDRKSRPSHNEKNSAKSKKKVVKF